MSMSNAVKRTGLRGWSWLIVFLTVLGSTIVIMLVLKVAGFKPWADTSAGAIAEYGSEHCEQVRTDEIFVQGPNFWSNFAYLLVGLMIYFSADEFIGRGTGIAICILFFGSSFWHGTLTESGKFLDIIGVYVALIALGVYGIFEVRGLDSTQPTAPLWFCWALTLGLIAGSTKNIVPFHGSTVGAAILGPLLFALQGWGAVLFWPRRSAWALPGILSLFSFAWAAFMKFNDGDGNRLCGLFGHNGILQGHALWHVFSALMMLFVFEYFTSLRGRHPSVWPWR
jgi:hypothetical protein